MKTTKCGRPAKVKRPPIEELARLYEVHTSKEIAEYYGVNVIDLWNKSGITPLNARSHYHDWLHPNQYGYRRLAECVYRHLK